MNPTQKALALAHATARFLALSARGDLRLTSGGRLRVSGRRALAHHGRLGCDEFVGLDSTVQDGLVSAGPRFLLALLTLAGAIAPVGDSLSSSDRAFDWLELRAGPQLNWQPLASLPPSITLAQCWRRGLSATLAALSSHDWTPVGQLIDAFDTHTPSRHNVARNLPHVRRAFQRQTAQMATFLLTWTLPALGLVAVSMRNGACHLQPTVEGAAWLQAALDQAHRLTGADDHVALELTVPRDALSRHGSRKASVEVTADDALSVIIPLDAPVVCSFHVVHLGDLLSPGPPARFRLTATTLHRAVEWGYSFADAVLTLSRYAGAPLPVEAVAILERWRAQVTTVSCLAGYRLDFREPETLNALRQRTPFRRRTTPLTTGQAVWVPQSETQGLFRYLRRLGYALQVLGGAEGEASGAPKGQGPAWASSTWLALVRTYELLRQFFPGLAHLRTGDLRGFFL